MAASKSMSVGRFLFTYKVSLFIVIRPLFQYFIQYDIDDHNKYKQHQSDGEQHLSVQSGRISHLADNSCGQESHGVKWQRHIDAATGYQCDRHSLADGTSHSQNDSRHDTGFCCRKDGAENSLCMGGSQGQRGGFDPCRNRPDGSLTEY